MKCAENLFEDGQKYSVYSCILDLGHPGAHEDARRRKYPRPRPSGELSLDVLSHLEESLPPRIYDLDERTYPVMVEVTTRYVVWVDAESEEAALAYWADDPTDLHLDKHTALDGDLEIQRIDHHTAVDAFLDRRHGERYIGPKIQCPGCGKDSFRREWFHDPYRKCHGAIEWRENAHARGLQWRYRREFKATALAGLEQVTA